MRNVVLIALLVSGLFACNFSTENVVESRVNNLLKAENYFELRTVYNTYKSDISAKLAYEVEAYLLNTFNKNEASNQKINVLVENFGNELSDSSKAQLELLKADNYLKLFDYKQAMLANNKVIYEYQNVVDSATLADAKTMNNIYKPLANTKAQKVSITENNIIPIKRDGVGLMNIEVNIKGNNYDFIFDTGAGMSVIKKSFAESLGIEMIETSIDVQSATDKIVKSSLAVVDSLVIGNILVLNSVFLVVEDAQLEFPQINFFPLAAIGFPVMEEFKEFTITHTDTLLIPKSPTKSRLKNMRLNGLVPCVNLFNGFDTLEYAFDTGATKTHFTSKYFSKYKAILEAKYTKDSVRTSSAGGSRMNHSYLLDSTDLYIGSHKAKLNKIHVHIDYNDTFEEVYGNLGQDLIKQFNSMTLNFEDMYLKFD